MRIVVATQEDPFYLPPALDALCRARPRDVVGIIILPAFNEGLRETAGRLWEFYGPVDFVRLGLRFAGAKVADRLNGVGPLTRPYSARDVARRHGVPVYAPAEDQRARVRADARRGDPPRPPHLRRGEPDPAARACSRSRASAASTCTRRRCRATRA